MNCNEVMSLLMAYLDGETAPAERERIDRHIESCPDCREELTLLTHMAAGLRSTLAQCTTAPARPAETWLRIRERIRTTEPARTPTLFRLRREIQEISKRWKMNVLGQPKWKLATAVTAVVALIVTLTLALPSFGGDEDMALAAGKLAQNSEAVKAACGGEGEVEILDISTHDGKGYVLCTTNMGQLINANIDLDEMNIEATEPVDLPGVSPVEKAQAVDIAKTDPTVNALLENGGRINSVYPVYSFEWGASDTVQSWTPELDLMTVEVYHAEGGKITFVDIDPKQATIQSIREAEVITDSGSIIGPDGHDVSDICVTTITDLTDGAPEVTAEQREKAIEIARTDPRSKRYFDEGAVITSVWGFYERNLVFLREDVDAEPIISVQRYPLVVLRLESPDDILNLKVDLNTGEVVAMDSIAQTIVQKEVHVVGNDDCIGALEPGELMDIAVSNPNARRLLVDEGGVIGMPVTCVTLQSPGGETAELMQVPIEVGPDRWMMEIDLATKAVTQLTETPHVESGAVERVQGPAIPPPSVDPVNPGTDNEGIHEIDRGSP